LLGKESTVFLFFIVNYLTLINLIYMKNSARIFQFNKRIFSVLGIKMVKSYVPMGLHMSHSHHYVKTRSGHCIIN
jgi:hypothetical protein